MLQIGLQAIPKQNLQVSLGGNLYDLNVLQTQGVMSMDIVSVTAGVNVLGQRCLVGQLVIPFKRLEKNAGNFMFLTAADALPDYEEFGITQSLFYISNAELVALRPGPVTVVSLFQTHGTMPGAATVHGVP